ncbi:hypothetical protein PIB30_041299 [Stylosanthes scabra]|uniref:Uncharacterized protein n=1 Tax=Stylosanthes scabra TaxID=79078 RepID=A0ABU6ZDM0_9FABA|nr:hypothetical protein [Stylosanthes scabra]
MSIKSSFTLETLKRNLHKKIGLKDNEVVGMAYRIPHAVYAGKWQLASTQRNSKNSTPNSDRNPPYEENILMRDILNDISDHEDDLLHAEEEDVDIDLGQQFQVIPTMG